VSAELSEQTQRLVAFEGDFELLHAAWDLTSGRTVELRVIEDEKNDRVHPFKKYQKRRGGRVGTRFHCTMTHAVSTQLVLNSEVQLAAWAEGSDKGQSVKFWIDEDASLHPFAGYRGKRGKSDVGDMFLGIFVELDDDNRAIDQVQRDRVERATGRKAGVSQYAWQLAHLNPRFVQFLAEKATRPAWMEGKTWDADTAHKFIKYVTKVESLGDLDRMPEAAQRFHDWIRKPFARFTGEL
jgi:hypothetical protein